MKLKRKTKFWLVVSAILALILGLLITWTVHKVKDWRWHHAGPIENHPVRIHDVNFDKEFHDLNEVQLALAQAIGVPPVKDRDEAERMKNRLVEIKDNDLYSVGDLSHSIPFLIPSAAELLDRIGRNFQDSLASKGLNPNKLFVSSVLRIGIDLEDPHGVALAYADVPPEYLRATLSQVLKDLHDDGACYVKYEKKQSCFHITVRK